MGICSLDCISWAQTCWARKSVLVLVESGPWRPWLPSAGEAWSWAPLCKSHLAGAGGTTETRVSLCLPSWGVTHRHAWRCLVGPFSNPNVVQTTERMFVSLPQHPYHNTNTFHLKTRPAIIILKDGILCKPFKGYRGWRWLQCLSKSAFEKQHIHMH